MKRLSYLFSLLLFVSVNVLAQEEGGDAENAGAAEEQSQQAAPAEVQALRAEDNGGYNPLSRRPIHLSDQMYRKTIWRALDLREKQNKPFFASGRELSRIIMDAVKQGKLTPYSSDSTNRPLSLEDFDKKCMIPGQDVEEDDGFGEDAWGDEEDGGWGDEEAEEEVEISPYYLENTLYVFQLKEDMIFDKQRSRMFYDILSVGMFVPADNADNVKGIEEPIAFFRYVDLLEIFESDPRAFWFNPQNDAAHRNMADAFDLRLFSSYIIKVSNPDGEYLVDTYGTPEKGIIASYKTMYELLEYEHNLWEF